MRPSGCHQGRRKREQHHNQRRYHQNRAGREEAYRAADLLSFLAEFGFGEIDFVLNQLCELRKRIA